MQQKRRRTAAQHLVDALVMQGADRVFCVPGESYLPVLDALHDQAGVIDLITCRHEGGAAMMAEADGKLTGRPGICMVTRGPGATNGSSGLQVAMQDSTPMIMFIGQVGRGFIEREAFQEFDYRRMFGQLTKWVAQIDTADRIAEFVARAYAIAISGRPGPVALALPEDMLEEELELAPAARIEPVEIEPSPSQMVALGKCLAAAERPLMIVGGSRWDERATKAVMQFADVNDLPVIASFRRQDRFDNGHRCYVGDIGLGVNPALAKRVQNADLVVSLNARMGEVPSNGYSMLEIPTPGQKLVHIMPEPREIGMVYAANLGIVATPIGFATSLEQLAPILKPRWGDWLRQARREYEAWQQPTPVPGRFNFGEALVALADALPLETIFTNGAGNFSAWLHRFYRYRRLGTQLAPTSGSMGYGVPAAIAAKLRYPRRPVICIAGDGDFLMTGQELATAMQFGASAVFIVIDNGMYGTIRMHQERHFPGRVSGTDLRNPDFVAYGAAYGAQSMYVDTTDALAPAVLAALQKETPTLVHVRTDPEALTANQSLSQIRQAAMKGNTTGR